MNELDGTPILQVITDGVTTTYTAEAFFGENPLDLDLAGLTDIGLGLEDGPVERDGVRIIPVY